MEEDSNSSKVDLFMYCALYLKNILCADLVINLCISYQPDFMFYMPVRSMYTSDVFNPIGSNRTRSLKYRSILKNILNERTERTMMMRSLYW